MWRVRARRAASIWRAVMRSGSIALRPKWPKLKLAPLVATPLIRPLCALRNLVRLGCSMALRLFQLAKLRQVSALAARAAGLALGHSLVLRHRVVLEDLALEDPNLDAAGAVGGKRGGDAVVDISAQCMQRHPAFAIPFHAGDFGAAQPAPAIYADAL